MRHFSFCAFVFVSALVAAWGGCDGKVNTDPTNDNDNTNENENQNNNHNQNTDPICGNGMLESGEVCDGTNLGDATCADQGFDGGWLDCTTQCELDTRQCTTCGDDTCEAGERAATCPQDCAAVAVSTGGFHTCALFAPGAVKCWGSNVFGQLGDGTTQNRLTPANVSALDDTIALSAGWGHTCAVGGDRTVYCWGLNEHGRLGTGDEVAAATPIAVNGVADGVAISAGWTHTCALRSDGTARCWGFNNSGQLGCDNRDTQFEPIAVANLSAATAIGCGFDFTCALLDDGTVYCWGNNRFGQLGNDDADGQHARLQTVPVPVSNLTEVTALAVGYDHACARTTSGTVHCWGRNNHGQLGTAADNWSDVPVTVESLSSVERLAAGARYNCVVLMDATAQCWGHNGSGGLGDGTYESSFTPVVVSGLSDLHAVAASNGPDVTSAHTCGLLNDGTVRCWGLNTHGQLGNGLSIDSPVAVQVLGF
jgi:alpha-tubulin suppressor-like RCC1 family protein